VGSVRLAYAAMRPLYRFAAGTTAINLMTAAAALVRGKLAALILGTTGVGVFGQVDSFYRGLVQICILSTGAGVTRCVAELYGHGDHASIRRAFWSITAFSLCLAAFASSLVLFSSKGLAGLVLGKRQYGLFLAVVSLGLPLQAVSDIIMGMLVGLRELRAQVSITAAYTGGGVILYTLLIFHYGLEGAVYSFVAIAACACLASVLLLRRRLGSLLKLTSGEKHFDIRLLRTILVVGLTGGIMAISDRVVVLIFRTILIRHFGLEANGLYQVVYSLSQLTITLAFGFVGTYLIPTLLTIQDNDRAHGEFRSALRLTLLISTACSAITILYGKLLITVTYSSAFLGAMPLLRYQAIGDFFRALALLLSGTIFSVHGWKPWFVIGMSFYIAYVVLFGLLLPVFGFEAISIAYLFAQLSCCALAVFFFTRYTNLNFFSGTAPLLFRSVALLLTGLLVACLGKVEISYVLGTIALLIWIRFAFTPSEYRRLWSYVSTPVAVLGPGDH
jgi:enterobacterial common antigen flippase